MTPPFFIRKTHAKLDSGNMSLQQLQVICLTFPPLPFSLDFLTLCPFSLFFLHLDLLFFFFYYLLYTPLLQLYLFLVLFACPLIAAPLCAPGCWL